MCPHLPGRVAWISPEVGARRTGEILTEQTRCRQLSDVVVVAAHPRQQPVRADGVGSGLGQVRHHQAVGPGAGGLARQAGQQRMGGIGELQEGEVGGASGQ
jgi:hypothetical protein